MEVYIRHGGASEYYTVRLLGDLKRLTEGIHSAEVRITICKNHTQAELELDEADAFLLHLKWIYSQADEVMYFSPRKIETGPNPTKMIPESTPKKYKMDQLNLRVDYYS